MQDSKIELPLPRWQVVIYYRYEGVDHTDGPHIQQAESQVEADLRAMLAFLSKHPHIIPIQLESFMVDSHYMTPGLEQLLALREELMRWGAYA